MRKYASMSFKRTWVWASTNRIAALDLGPMSASERASSKTLTTRYRDAKGKQRFKGNSSLKPSQRLYTCFNKFFDPLWNISKSLVFYHLVALFFPGRAPLAAFPPKVLHVQVCLQTCVSGAPRAGRSTCPQIPCWGWGWDKLFFQAGCVETVLGLAISRN